MMHAHYNIDFNRDEHEHATGHKARALHQFGVAHGPTRARGNAVECAERGHAEHGGRKIQCHQACNEWRHWLQHEPPAVHSNCQRAPLGPCFDMRGRCPVHKCAVVFNAVEQIHAHRAELGRGAAGGQQHPAVPGRKRCMHSGPQLSNHHGIHRARALL